MSKIVFFPGIEGRYYVLYFILVTKFSDSGAYAVGSLIGKHKMIPRISPAKTWEGFGGAIGVATGASLIYAHYFADKMPGMTPLHAVVLGDHPVLLANVEGEVFAIANRCADSPLPLQFGTLREHVITCSWHGCQYDVRTGHRVDGPGPGVAVFPVRVSGDDIQVVIAVTPVGRTS